MITIFNQKLRVIAKIHAGDPVFSLSLMFYYIFLKYNRELRIKILEFVILILVLNVMKYFNHSEVYDDIKTCSQLHFFTYESINTCDTV